MKKISLVLVLLMFWVNCFAGQMSLPYTMVNDTLADATEPQGNDDYMAGIYNTHDTATTGVHGMGASTIVGTDLPQILTLKNLTSPTITASPTAAGATWTDLGTVTTVDISDGTAVFSSSTHTWVDINGGTIDGTLIGSVTPSTGTFLTVDTGQGMNELYDMDQNVQTTDDVTFSSATVTNTFTVKKITLSAAETRYYSIGAEGGGMRAGTQDYLLTYSAGKADLQSGSDTVATTVIYPINLPHATPTITSLNTYWYTADVSTGTASLIRCELDNDAIATMATTGTTASAGAHSDEDTTVDPANINNNIYSYYLAVTLDPNDAAADVKFYGACITYTITSILP